MRSRSVVWKILAGFGRHWVEWVFYLFCFAIYFVWLAAIQFYLWDAFLSHGEPSVVSTPWIPMIEGILAEQANFRNQVLTFFFVIGLGAVTSFFVFRWAVGRWLSYSNENKVAGWLQKSLMSAMLMFSAASVICFFKLSEDWYAVVYTIITIVLRLSIFVVFYILVRFIIALCHAKAKERARDAVKKISITAVTIITMGIPFFTSLFDYLFGRTVTVGHEYVEFFANLFLQLRDNGSQRFALHYSIDFAIACTPFLACLLLYLLLKYCAPSSVGLHWRNNAKSKFYTMEVIDRRR